MKRQRVNPFPNGSAERVLFDRYRRANLAAIAAERAEMLARTEAQGYRAQADRYAEALRALGHGDKVPGQPALPAPIVGAQSA